MYSNIGLSFRETVPLNCHLVKSGCVLLALKVFCLAKYAQYLDTNIEFSQFSQFSSVQVQILNLGGCGHFHSQIGRYAINAEIFKCNILSVPLVNLILIGWRTILNERAFKQCIAT